MERTEGQFGNNVRQVVRETLEAKEVAAILGLSEWTVYNLARQRLIPHVRVGTRRLLFRRASILQWLEAQERASVTPEPQEEEGGVRRLK